MTLDRAVSSRTQGSFCADLQFPDLLVADLESATVTGTDTG